MCSTAESSPETWTSDNIRAEMTEGQACPEPWETCVLQCHPLGRPDRFSVCQHRVEMQIFNICSWQLTTCPPTPSSLVSDFPDSYLLNSKQNQHVFVRDFLLFVFIGSFLSVKNLFKIQLGATRPKMTACNYISLHLLFLSLKLILQRPCFSFWAGFSVNIRFLVFLAPPGHRRAAVINHKHMVTGWQESLGLDMTWLDSAPETLKAFLT